MLNPAGYSNLIFPLETRAFMLEVVLVYFRGTCSFSASVNLRSSSRCPRDLADKKPDGQLKDADHKRLASPTCNLMLTR